MVVFPAVGSPRREENQPTLSSHLDQQQADSRTAVQAPTPAGDEAVELLPRDLLPHPLRRRSVASTDHCLQTTPEGLVGSSSHKSSKSAPPCVTLSVDLGGHAREECREGQE